MSDRPINGQNNSLKDISAGQDLALSHLHYPSLERRHGPGAPSEIDQLYSQPAFQLGISTDLDIPDIA